MGSENAEQSDETLEAQQRFQEFGIGSDPSKSKSFSDDPLQEKVKKAAYDQSQQNISKALTGQLNDKLNLGTVQNNPALQSFKITPDMNFAREQYNIDELGYNPDVESIDVGPYDVFGLEKQIADQLALGNVPVYNADGSIGGVTSRRADTQPFTPVSFALKHLFPESKAYTGRNELNPFQTEKEFYDDGDDQPTILPRSQTVAQVEEKVAEPEISSDLALNYLQNPYYLYSGADNLYQPYGYGQGTLVDLLKTRNLTQPTSAVPNLNLFANPRDFA